MARFLHTADWHLGAPQHPRIYREQLLPKFTEFICDNHVNDVLCVGDVFDQHNPDQRIKDALLQFLISSPCNFTFVVGNHDFSDKTRTYHSIQYLKILQEKLDNVVVYDTTGVHEFFVGNCRMSLLTVVDDDWDSVQNFPLTEKVDIVAWHGTVPGISFDNGVNYKKNSQLESFLKRSKCTYFALGDIHKHLKLATNCWYPGALVQKTYGCESGLLEVTINADSVATRSLKLDLPEKVNLPVTFEVGRDSEQSIIAFIKENYPTQSLLRLIFNLPAEVWASLDKELIKAELVEFGDVKLDNIVREGTTKQRQHGEEIRKCKTLEEELKMLIDQEADIDREELLKVCREILCD